MHKRTLTRRQFIGEASCKAVGATAFFSTLLNLRMTATAAANSLPQSAGDDYKALVCLFLAGGNDSFNMLVPRDSESYALYASSRDNLALPSETLLPITSNGQEGTAFGLHPALLRLQQIYLDGKAAFVANTGTLIRPTSLQDFQNKYSLPQGLFSHSDQQMHWQTLLPQIRGGKPGGWGGRTADLLHSLNDLDTVSMSISLAGTNIFQTGKATFPFVAPLNNSSGLTLLENETLSPTIESFLDQQYANIFHSTLGTSTRRARDASAAWENAVGPIELNTTFPTTGLGRQLQAAAKAIAAHQALGLRRQTFFVRKGGWDNHSELLDTQDALLGDLDASLGAFWDALGEIGAQNQVTLFTASDFGRTLTSNSQGTDHAWGGNHFVVGGAVKGGRIYGQYPSLDLGNPLDTGRGRLIPTTSVDAYFAEMASWFGVPSGELETVFPNCSNFFDPRSQAYPLGYLGD